MLSLAAAPDSCIIVSRNCSMNLQPEKITNPEKKVSLIDQQILRYAGVCKRK